MELTAHASAASSRMQRRRAAHMPREDWQTALCTRTGCITVCLLATVLVLGIRYSTSAEDPGAPPRGDQVPQTASPWGRSSMRTAAHGQGRKPAEVLPVCQQPSLHAGGGVFIVPDLLDDAAPCRPPLTAAGAKLAGAVISEYSVPGALSESYLDQNLVATTRRPCFG